LLAIRHSRADVMLDINLALQMGDWERFPSIVDREWSARRQLDAEVLMQLAVLASEADNSVDRALELAALAADKAPDNAHILVGAYALGFQLGKEDKVNPDWLRRALELSAGGGPVWQVDMKTLVYEMAPAHRERAKKIEEDLLRGDIPLQAAAKALNLPLARLLMDIPRQNAETPDGRGRVLLPILSGARSAVEIQPTWKIAFDVTSIMVLWSLGILKTTLNALRQVVFSPDIMVLLLNERRRVLFHQPSLVVRAEEIRELVDQNYLKLTGSSVEPPNSLVSEVGRDLAELLMLAKQQNGKVVRPFPIFKLSSLMQEEANLGEFTPYLLSCRQLVQTLLDAGRIDSDAHARAEEYLSAHDRSPNKGAAVDVLRGPLFLDDLALTYLASAGVLRRMSKSDLDISVHYTIREEKTAIASAYREGSALASALNEVRVILRDALDRGTATLFPSQDGNIDKAAEGISELFPVLSQLLTDTRSADAVCIDDRGFNRHISITDQQGNVARIIALPDLLTFLTKTGAITERERQGAIYRARRAGFILFPIDRSELDRELRRAKFAAEGLIETEELRALRQSVMRIRSSGALSQPLETKLLDDLRLACVLEIRQLWSDESLSPDQAASLCSWVWKYVSPCPLQWSHTIREPSQVMAPEQAFVRYVAMLLQPMLLLKGSRYKHFIKWCDEMVLEPLTLSNGKVLDQIADLVATNLEAIANELAKD
jgi:hypothetical protein